MTFEEIMSRIEIGKTYKLLTEDWETDPHTTVRGRCIEKWEDAVGFMVQNPDEYGEDSPEEFYAEIYEGELEEIYRGPVSETF